jgi:hypothetical protein
MTGFLHRGSANGVLSAYALIGAIGLAACSHGGTLQDAAATETLTASEPTAPAAAALPSPPPAELAEMPSSRRAYRSSYTIPGIGAPWNVESGTDATIEATTDPRIFKFSGKTEFLTNGTSNNWGPGARHTVKGKVIIKDYTIVSDNNDPLVFTIVDKKGYVYQRGRGMVITPTNEKVFLDSGGRSTAAAQIASSPSPAKNAATRAPPAAKNRPGPGSNDCAATDDRGQCYRLRGETVGPGGEKCTPVMDQQHPPESGGTMIMMCAKDGVQSAKIVRVK